MKSNIIKTIFIIRSTDHKKIMQLFCSAQIEKKFIWKYLIESWLSFIYRPQFTTTRSSRDSPRSFRSWSLNCRRLKTSSMSSSPTRTPKRLSSSTSFQRSTSLRTRRPSTCRATNSAATWSTSWSTFQVYTGTDIFIQIILYRFFTSNIIRCSSSTFHLFLITVLLVSFLDWPFKLD